MIAADSVDTTVVAAFAVGFVSFVSPCVLPLVPGYLSTISGVSFADIQEGRGRAPGARPGAPVLPLVHGHVRRARHDAPPAWARRFRTTAPCCARSPGVVIALLGVLFIATLFVPKLNREWRPEELMRRAHTGGPIDRRARVRRRLAAVHRAHARRDPHRRLDRGRPSAKGGVLLAFYALGLAVPFILSALAFSTFSGVFKFFRNHYARDHARLGGDPDRDGRAALHERADPAERRGAQRRWTT